MEPICSIIIRTRNESRYLGRLLDAVEGQVYPSGGIETIVVDSGSTDATLEIAARHGCKIVHVAREQFSFGRSLNLGCTEAKAQYLVFISGHCVPTNSQWLGELLRPFARAGVAISYGRQVGGPETKFSEHLLLKKYFPENVDHGLAPYFCNNANLAMRASCWKDGKFDETLTGLEDLAAAKLLWQRGWEISYAPKAAVFHFHHESWRQVKLRYEREAIALQAIMPEVHVHWHDALRYLVAGVLGDWRQSAEQKEFLAKAGQIVAFRSCQYYGVWRGNHHHRRLSRQQKDRYFYPN